jgi:choline dehydrogenase-like flavoprotein
VITVVNAGLITKGSAALPQAAPAAEPLAVSAAGAATGDPAASGADPAVAKTHAALFETYLPVADVPADIRALIDARAVQVSAGLLAAIEGSPTLAGMLALLTYPGQLLPAEPAAYLSALGDPAVNQFLAGGYPSLAPEQRDRLWDAFFAGPADRAGPHPAVLTRIAATLRLVYLSGIWDLPIGGALAGIQSPKVFTDNLDVWVAAHQPDLPAPVLRYDPATGVIAREDGRPIDYLVVGSGPGGATVASQLQAAGALVVLVDKGPFVVWGSMDTRSYPELMYRNNAATTVDGSILIRSGQAVGGGTTVNIDLAFSPLAPTVQSKIQSWIADGLIDPDRYRLENLARTYTWVREVIKTREVAESELNRDNRVLWDGAKAYGVDPSLYHLNRFPVGDSPSAVDDKRDATRQLLLPAMSDAQNPLSVIPDADAVEILFDGATPPRATGVRLLAQAPWTAYANTLVDPCRLGIPAGAEVTISARTVIVSAGTIGSSRLLLQTARKHPTILNASPASPIGRGLVLHPSVPIIGLFDEEIKLLEGLDSATFVDSFGPTDGFIYETMSGLPAYGAVMIPGSAAQVYAMLAQFQRSAGFGLMRVDSSSPDNRLVLNATGDDVDIVYTLTAEDRAAMRRGLALGIRMMFLAGARTVIIPSNENVLGLPDFRPTRVTYLTDIAQADAVEANIEFIPNRTLLTSAHLQATNKMGPSPERAAVSTNQRVWSAAGAEIANLYVMDSSIFPTSVGANPMQSIYCFAKIFAEWLIAGAP